MHLKCYDEMKKKMKIREHSYNLFYTNTPIQSMLKCFFLTMLISFADFRTDLNYIKRVFHSPNSQTCEL